MNGRGTAGARTIRIASDGLREAVRHAVRSLRRTPGLVITIVAVFALGIGANATMLETLDRVLLRAPPHVSEPEVVKRIYIANPAVSGEILTYPDFEDVRDMAGFAAAAAYGDAVITVGRGETAEQLRGIFATHEYWRVLGIGAPALGRYFDAADDAPGAEPVAVIGYRVWQDRYGGSPAVIGEAFDFGYGPYTIVGVAPPGLTSLEMAPADFVLPLQVAARHLRGTAWPTSRQMYFIRAVARLAPGAAMGAIEGEATARHRAGRAEMLGASPDAAVLLTPLIWARGSTRRGDVDVSIWLAGVALIVLLTATLNVANLLLARSIRARREIAIRLALGISRRRLVGQMLAEGAILGLCGAAAALLLDRWLGAAVRQLIMPSVPWHDLGTNVDLWAILALTGVVVGTLSVLPGAFRFSRPEVTIELKGTGAGTPHSVLRFRGALSVAQAAFSVLLLIGAGLFIRSLDAIHSQDMGFRPDGLYVATLVSDPGSIPPAERQALLGEAVDRIRRLPGVTRAAMTLTMPFRGTVQAPIAIPGVEELPASPIGYSANAVGEGLLETMGIRIIEGRGLEAADHQSGARVIVVGETMARSVWPGEYPIGRCVQVGGEDFPCSTVIGIAADPRKTRLTPGEEVFQYWVPAESLQSNLLRPTNLVIRLADREAAIAVRRELLNLDPRVRFVEIESYREVMDPWLRSWPLGATLFSAFGLLALVVAALGMYSVIAFDVVQRTREIGVRTALGATAGAVAGVVIARGMRLALLGVVIGLLAAALLAPRLEGLLFDVSGRDPATFVTVAGTLLLVALLATALPARRASRVDPVIALRSE